MREQLQDYQLKAFENNLSEYMATYQVELSNEEKSAVQNLYFECGERWAVDHTAKVADIAGELDLSDLRPELKQMVLNIWTDVYMGE